MARSPVVPNLRRSRIRVTVGIGAFVVAIFVSYMVLRDLSIYKPLPFNQQKLDEIVLGIKDKRLKSNGGIVQLPPGLASASITRRAYVMSGKSTLVFVPSWIGRQTLLHTSKFDDNYVEGYIFSSYALSTTGDDQFIWINVPSFVSPDRAAGDSGIQLQQICVLRKSANHWYVCGTFS